MQEVPIVREVALSSAIKVNPVLHEIMLTFGVNDKSFSDFHFFWIIDIF